MTLDELLVELNKLKEEGHGDSDVCVYADHGQETINAYTVSLEDYNEDDQVCVHKDDLGEYEGSELEKIILISG